MPDRLALAGLRVAAGRTELVHDVSLALHAGEVVGLVGPSGCGKTMTARSLLGLVDVEPGVVAADLEIHFKDHVLRPYDACLGKGARAREKAFQPLRGRVVGYLPQDAIAALDPLLTVGRQVSAAARLRRPDRDDPTPWIARAGLPNPERVLGLYPHELSGGMAQRVVIAQALARGSRFLLADEPTTGLDPTIALDILTELRSLRLEGIGLLFITHDLRLLIGLADRVIVMDGGRVVEHVTPEQIRAGDLASESGRRLIDATRRVAAGRLG